MFQQYLQRIYKTYLAGDASERSFYPDLKKLVEDFLESKGFRANITIESRIKAEGIPDFTVRKNKQLIGYIEAKDINTEDLQMVSESEQLERYKTKPNLILTNFCEFWLWRDGQWIKKVRIAMPRVLNSLKIAPPLQNEKQLAELLNIFISYNIPETKTAKSLAKELAQRAKLLPSYIVYLLNDDKEEEIDRIYNAFRKFLISDLSKEDFADIYAQTITYGLFTARIRHSGEEKFTRFLAQRLIPKNIQILRDTFSLISSQTLPEHITWIVDDIATILAFADMEKIKKELHREKGGDDPLMHFYETFLKEYDPKKRKARGVYYTPLPVVSYITRSINILLKEKFGKKLGFASEGVTLLDPASGTLTFPANAIAITKEEIDKSPNAGSWPQIVKNHILKNYYAFELLMAPYIIGHLKVSLLLEDLGYKMENGERFQLYLTNTLDLSDIEKSTLPFVAGLSEEAEKARVIKKDTPILVVMGNPPYSSGHSKQSDFIKDAMKDYLTGLGVEKEKKKGVMQDDYIRFIRFAHWKIEQAGCGIIGLITNNSYLDGIIHRAMRKKILDDFDEIYILNLHGNSRIKEKTLAGGKDENVFDIQQGVGIILMVKSGAREKKIKYFDLYGLRKEKGDFLESHDVKNTKWQELDPKEPNFWFAPKDSKGIKKYNKFISLKNIFGENGSGVITRRDNFVVSTNLEELKNRIQIFINKNLPKEFIEKGLAIQDTYEWSFEEARNKVAKDNDLDKKYFEYLYRPFDKRWIIYHESLISRPSALLRKSFSNRENIGLICSRRTPTGADFNHVFISSMLIDIHSAADQSYVFPLYLYNSYAPKKEKPVLSYGNIMLFDKPKEKEPNIKTEIIKKLSESYKRKIAPEEIFYYIYAILYSNIYRKKYNEFLKID
ncbi:MAG: type ISP restriction/modification enzyme, partial [Patescibacteria group bacterium]